MRVRSSVPLSRRLLRLLKRVSAGLGVIVVLYVLAGLVCDALIWAEVGRIRREGDPTSVAELQAPMPPDSRNGAVYYRRAFALVETNRFREIWRLDSEYELKSDPMLWKKAAAEAPQFESVVALARVAASKPACVFRENRNGTSLRQNYRIYVLSGMVIDYARLLAHEQHGDEAYEILRLSLRVADALRSDHYCISYMDRSGIYSRCARTAAEIADEVPVSEAQAKALSDALAQNGLLADCRRAQRWERAIRISDFRHAARHGFREDEMYGSYRAVGTFESSVVGRPLLWADELSYLRSMRRAKRDILIPFREQPKPPPPTGLCECEERHCIWPYSNACSYGYDVYKLRRYADTSQANICTARVAMALCIYRQRYREYPAKLHDLRRLGWRLDLVDPFSGRELVYRRTPKGCMVYSIGPNLKDDGGEGPRSLGSVFDGGDIVRRLGK